MIKFKDYNYGELEKNKEYDYFLENIFEMIIFIKK